MEIGGAALALSLHAVAVHQLGAKPPARRAEGPLSGHESMLYRALRDLPWGGSDEEDAVAGSQPMLSGWQRWRFVVWTC